MQGLLNQQGCACYGPVVGKIRKVAFPKNSCHVCKRARRRLGEDYLSVVVDEVIAHRWEINGNHDQKER